MSMHFSDMQKESGHKKIISYIKSVGHYAFMKDFKSHNFKSAEIKSLVQDGTLEKIKPGLYRLSNIKEPPEISIDFIDTAKAIPVGIICLASALSYYELTTYNPSRVDVAIPNNARAKKIIKPPVNIYFFRDRFYTSGVENIKTPYGTVKIYCAEKTVCDMFRYRKKLGEDIALEGLKNYLNLKSANLNKLRKFSKICNVKTIITPYIKSLAGN